MAASLSRVLHSRALLFLKRASLVVSAHADGAVAAPSATAPPAPLWDPKLDADVWRSHGLLHSKWSMQSSHLFLRVQALRFSTASESQQRPKKKKKQSKRGIIKKLKQLRYVTKIKKANMDHEQKLLARIERAKKKIDDLQKALKAYELPALPPAQHDPESLTPEELHYLKRLGYKHKNYMIIGIRGVFGGVVLNMHLHWKKHQLIKVRCKNYTREEIDETGEQLARLSGGIVVDVQKGDTIVMYRGRNYVRPPDLTPKNTLSKRKALFKAKFEQSLESTNKNLLLSEKELVLYREHKAKEEAGLFSRKPIDGYTSTWSDTEEQQPTRPRLQHSDSEDIDVDPALICDSDSVLESESDLHDESASDFDTDFELDPDENDETSHTKEHASH